MEILAGFEHNYVMPYGVMFQSLVQNNQNEIINVHAIINESVTEDDKNELKNILTKYNSKNTINYYIFDYSLISNNQLPVARHFRGSCYYRLFASTILPNNIDKVLYLDGDMVVRHNISELWNFNMEGYAVAGTINQTEKVEFYNRLHYPMRKKYINNGVALFNLKKWRQEGIEQKFIDMIIEHPERILNADQDVMNVVLQDDKTFFPIKFNVQEGFYYQLQYMDIDYWEYQKEIDEAVADPWILHYAGGSKPWLKGCKHPLRDEFFKYQSNTIWRDFPLGKKNLKLKVRFLFYIRSLLAKMKIIEIQGDVNRFVESVGEK